MTKFEKACEEGAQEFGGLWLRANEVAVDAIRIAGGNCAETKTKTMMAIAVLRVLILARHNYTGRKKRTDRMPMTDRERRIAGFAHTAGMMGDSMELLQTRLEQLHAKGMFDTELPMGEIVKRLLANGPDA